MIYAETLCPSGLRGWTQVPLARAARVQIPQVSVIHSSGASTLRHIYTTKASGSTVAILAQGTSWAVAVTQALFRSWIELGTLLRCANLRAATPTSGIPGALCARRCRLQELRSIFPAFFICFGCVGDNQKNPTQFMQQPAVRGAGKQWGQQNEATSIHLNVLWVVPRQRVMRVHNVHVSKRVAA